LLGPAVPIFEFLVPLQLPGLSPYRGAATTWIARTRMSIRLAAEHCTLAPNVKAGDVKRIYFSIECLTGRRPANAAFAFSQFLFTAGIEQNVPHRGAKIG
jgi:hypothetical protein